MMIKLAQAFREKMPGSAGPQGRFYVALSALRVCTGLLTQACVGPASKLAGADSDLGWYVSRLRRSLRGFGSENRASGATGGVFGGSQMRMQVADPGSSSGWRVVCAAG
jgi:hypothetical protein